MTEPILSLALQRAAHALDEDDAVAAAAALQEAARACDAALRRGLRVEGAEAGPLRGAHARCWVAAERARERIAAAIAAIGGARRARAAYIR